jgi:hypothetical protein
MIQSAVCLFCRRVCALLCTAAALGGAQGAFAMSRVEVFQATVPSAERSEAGQSATFQAALKVVLVRATGRRTADEEAVFAPLISNARRYVQQYRSAPDNQMWVAFDGAAIERWLVQNGQPEWGFDRPSTFVWVTVPGAGQSSTVLSADDTSELKLAIDAAAAVRGIPLVWPSPEAASTGAASGASPVAAADMGRRLGAEGVLIGRAGGTSAGAPVRWTLLFQDRSSESSGALEGVNHAADLYAGLYAASGSLAPLQIDVSGVVDVRDYAAVQGFLESLNFVTHVAIESLTGDTVRFRLTARGGIEPLEHAIALNGRLQSAAGGDAGVRRFELRR